MVSPPLDLTGKSGGTGIQTRPQSYSRPVKVVWSKTSLSQISRKGALTDYTINTYTMRDGLQTWAFKNNNRTLQSKLINTPLVLYKEVYLIDLPGHGATDYHMKIVYPAHEPQHKIELHFENKFEYNEKGEASKNKELFFYSKRQLDSANYKTMLSGIRKDFFNDSIERWMRTHKMNKINLVGHSYGGYFSFHLWKDRPDLVNKLVMLSPLGVEKNIWSINNLILQNDRYKYRFKNESVLFQQYSFENAYLQSNDNLELNTILFNSFFTNYLTSYDPILDYGEVIEQRKDDIKIIYGDHDWMDKRCANEFVNNCVISNAGHNLNIDNPKDTFREITNFVK
ncbi:unnamed protein product [Hanseniaspora opuntiae]